MTTTKPTEYTFASAATLYLLNAKHELHRLDQLSTMQHYCKKEKVKFTAERFALVKDMIAVLYAGRQPKCSDTEMINGLESHGWTMQFLNRKVV